MKATRKGIKLVHKRRPCSSASKLKRLGTLHEKSSTTASGTKTSTSASERSQASGIFRDASLCLPGSSMTIDISANIVEDPEKSATQQDEPHAVEVLEELEVIEESQNDIVVSQADNALQIQDDTMYDLNEDVNGDEIHELEQGRIFGLGEEFVQEDEDENPYEYYREEFEHVSV
jgi:hypothetical protein